MLKDEINSFLPQVDLVIFFFRTIEILPKIIILRSALKRKKNDKRFEGLKTHQTVI